MAALGSSGTAPHPGMFETAHRMTVTILAATPPAIAFVAVMTQPFCTLIEGATLRWHPLKRDHLTQINA